MRPPGVLRLIVTVTAITAMVLTACGEDDNDAPVAQPTQEEVAGEGDLELYCSLAQKLDRAGSKFFKELEQDEEATQEDFEKAEAEFVTTHQADIEELAEAAPSEIRADVDILIASLKARAGLGPEVDEKEAQSADKRVQQFEKENC